MTFQDAWEPCTMQDEPCQWQCSALSAFATLFSFTRCRYTILLCNFNMLTAIYLQENSIIASNHLQLDPQSQTSFCDLSWICYTACTTYQHHDMSKGCRFLWFFHQQSFQLQLAVQQIHNKSERKGIPLVIPLQRSSFKTFSGPSAEPCKGAWIKCVYVVLCVHVYVVWLCGVSYIKRE